MKIPYSWLKDYVNVGAMKADEMAEHLTTAGLEVVLIDKIGKDAIFDIEITPNRPDCLSILGIAREAAASLGAKLKGPKVRLPKTTIKDKPAIELKDKQLCLRYTARVLRNIKVGPSPKWLTDRLEKMGLRPVNNVADITNFCLFELGHPTHAFDYDRIKGKVIVRRAQKDEKIVTIDGRERPLETDMLVIADEEKAVALAGVMGSKNSEVKEDTRNILLESAYFDPISIRRTSRRLGLISESSYRFERSCDLGGVIKASDRVAALMLEICGGQAGPLVDIGAKDPKRVKIFLRPEKLNKILGIDISTAAIKKILALLQLDVEISGKGTIVVLIPSFRQDLKSEADLIEEVVRIYGYDKLPSTMPTIIGHPKRIERPRELCAMVRDAMAAMGVDEIITYSLISKDDLALVSEDFAQDEIVVIKNPLSIEQEIMRPSLIPGILGTVAWNLNRGTENIRLFEVGRIYRRLDNGFAEEERMSVAFVGNKGGGWLSKGEFTFFDAKGIFEALFNRLGIEDFSFRGAGFPGFLTGQAASIEVSGESVGFLGVLDKKVTENFDIEKNVLLSELDLEKVFSRVRTERKFLEMPRFPSAKRDISMVIRKDVPHQDIVSVVRDVGSELVADVKLFDQYFGGQIPQGSRSLAYSIEYRSRERTLTDDEVNRLHAKVCDALVEKLSATIR